MMKFLKQFCTTGLQIRALDNRWTGCKDEDVPKVAAEVVVKLNQILTKPHLDPDLKDWATNLKAVALQRLDIKR